MSRNKSSFVPNTENKFENMRYLGRSNTPLRSPFAIVLGMVGICNLSSKWLARGFPDL